MLSHPHISGNQFDSILSLEERGKLCRIGSWRREGMHVREEKERGRVAMKVEFPRRGDMNRAASYLGALNQEGEKVPP